ncbi:MAG: hypothetical protein ACKOX6_04040 [Bdellovibrio sp.]
MKNVKFLEPEEITLDEVNGEFVAIQFANERFVIDTDTLHDLTFRFAQILAHLEAQESFSEENELVCAECCGTLH